MMAAAPLGTAVAAGTDYYVSPSGDDGNPGTASEPWLTLGHAASVVVAGDTVHVEPGTYLLSSQLTLGASGVHESPITFVSTTPHEARVALTTDSTADRVVEIDGSNVTWSGFDVTAPNPSARYGVIAYGEYDVMSHNHVHDIATSGCTAVDTVHGGAGIDVMSSLGFGDSTDDYLDGNLIERIGPTTPGLACDGEIHGIYVSTTNNAVVNNVVSTVSGYGIHAFENVNDPLIANNDVDHAGYSGILVGCGAGYTAQNDVVMNNVVRDSGSNGLREYQATTGCPVGDNRFTNNDSFDNAAGEYFLYGTDGSLYVNGLDADPLYVAYAGGDRHLDAGSPAIGAGARNSAPDHDYDGRPRPGTAGVDLGAFQT
jgi:hypothetical protein